MQALKQRKWLTALVAVVVLAGAGAAVAYWTGGGSGTGTGTAGSGGTVTVTGTVGPGVAPGISVPVTFTAANPSTAAIQVTTVHLDSVAVDAGHVGCAVADFTMADVTQSHEVPKGATVEPLPVNGSLAYADTAVSQDACKGATLTLTLSST